MAIVATVVVCVGGAGTYTLAHLRSPTTVTLNGLTFGWPYGWDRLNYCSSLPIRDGLDGACLRPDPNADAGAYVAVFSIDPTENQTAPDLARSLGDRVIGYDACGARAVPGGEGDNAFACLQHHDSPERKAELRLRLQKTVAVMVLCVRTERSEIRKGCDIVWERMHITR